MHVANEHFQDGYLFVISLGLFNIIFLDLAQQKSRIIGRLGKTSGVLANWPGRGSDITFLLIWGIYFTVGILRDFVGPKNYWTLSFSGKVALAAIYLAMLVFFVSAIGFKRMRGLGDFRVSRGTLYTAVSKLSKQSKYFGLDGAPLYVIYDANFAKMCARAGSGVVLPFELLELLNRHEIDSLALRQLCAQSKKFYFTSFWILLACNVAVVSAVQWIRVAPPSSFLIFLSLLAAEFFALDRYLPHMRFQADLLAIQLTGDAESFFSALGGLSRFTGVPLQESMLQKIGRATGVSPDRIRALLAPHETKPEDRYPTTGSYMDTGL